MREIKFRAWYKNPKDALPVGMYQISTIRKKVFMAGIDEWTDMEEVEIFSPTHGRKKKGFGLTCTLKELELMQSTGLKDKTGKEIYEGDILSGNREVRCGEYFGPFGTGTGFHTVCFKGEYENAKAFEGQPFGLTSRQVAESEIIGNIYENPEILTQK